MPITPIFAAIFALIYIVLSLGVIGHRKNKRISRGDGDDRDLAVAIRVHANFIEYVPLAIILLWFLETIAYEKTLTFILASILLLARLLHVAGMHNPKKYLILRQIGVVATLSVILLAAGRILWQYTPL